MFIHTLFFDCHCRPGPRSIAGRWKKSSFTRLDGISMLCRSEEQHCTVAETANVCTARGGARWIRGQQPRDRQESALLIQRADTDCRRLHSARLIEQSARGVFIIPFRFSGFTSSCGAAVVLEAGGLIELASDLRHEQQDARRPISLQHAAGDLAPVAQIQV